MSLPTSLLSYTDCLDVFDKAVEDEVGVRVPFRTIDEATHFKMRLHMARKLTREDNTRLHQPGDLMYGKSVYDKIKVTTRTLKSGVYVYLKQTKIDPGVIESLADLEDEPNVFIAPAPGGPAPERRIPLDQVVEQIKRRV